MIVNIRGKQRTGKKIITIHTSYNLKTHKPQFIAYDSRGINSGVIQTFKDFASLQTWEHINRKKYYIEYESKAKNLIERTLKNG